MKITNRLLTVLRYRKARLLFSPLIVLAWCFLSIKAPVSSQAPIHPIARPRQPVPSIPSPTRTPATTAVTRNSNNEANTTDTPENTDGKTAGWMEVDVPEKVKIGKPFDMDIWLRPSDPNFSGTVKVFMEQTDRVQYNPRVFDLKPGERKTIKAQVNASESGLTEIIASADGWSDLSIPLDAGFSVKLRANNLPDSIDGGSIQDFNLEFVDSHGENIRLDAPVKLTLQSSKLEIHAKGEKVWGNQIDMNISAGASSTPVLEVRPESWSKTDTGMIRSEVKIENDRVLYDQTFPLIKIKPRWWLPLLLAVCGGILFSLYQVSQELSSFKGTLTRSLITVVISRIAPGALAGALAYLLANYDVLGFKADTTELRGFLILGFLFSYVGIDTILKLVAPQKGGGMGEHVRMGGGAAE